MTSNTHTTDKLIRHVSWAFFAQTLLTSIHHLYGGLAYDSTLRLSMPIFAVFELFVVLGLLFWYRRSNSRVVLTIFTAFMLLIGVVQGLFHTLYGHLYKDVLFLVGVSAENVRNFFLPVTPNDFIFPPNDLFFELTGLLELITIYFIIVLTYRIVRNRPKAG